MKNLFTRSGKIYIFGLMIFLAGGVAGPVWAANVGIIETPLPPLIGLQNLYYGNLPNGSGSSTALLLLQKGLTDRLRVDQMGNLTLTGKITASVVGPWTSSGNNIYSNNSGNVGIGQTNPTNGKLDVETASGHAIYGWSTDSTAAGYGVYGGDSGGGYGVYGYSNSGWGVYGNGGSSGYDFYGQGPKSYFAGSVGIGAINPVNGQLEISSANNGIYSVSSGATKVGVYGLNSSYIGVEGSGGLYGVFGTSGGTAGVLANGGSYGVYGTGSSYGVYGSGSTGINGSGTAYGGYFTGGQYGVYGSGTYYSIYGTNNSNLGYGVYGINTGGGVGVYGSGATYAGVWGSGYIGTYGDSSAVSGYGVYGHSSGNSGIAVRGDNTGTDNSSYGVYGDSINGIAIYGYSNNGYGGYFQGKGYLSAASWGYGSDRRLKENINYLDDSQVNALSYIDQLRPATFDYIKGEKNESGFIAQDVQTVLPNLVSTGPDGMLSLKTDELIPYLVKGMQEQQAQIEALQKKVEALSK